MFFYHHLYKHIDELVKILLISLILSNMQNSEPHTVSVPDAAKILGVHKDTLLGFIADGVLPAAKIGRRYILRTKDVIKYVDDQVIAQTAKRMRTPKSK